MRRRRGGFDAGTSAGPEGGVVLAFAPTVRTLSLVVVRADTVGEVVAIRGGVLSFPVVAAASTTPPSGPPGAPRVVDVVALGERSG